MYICSPRGDKPCCFHCHQGVLSTTASEKKLYILSPATGNTEYEYQNCQCVAQSPAHFHSVRCYENCSLPEPQERLQTAKHKVIAFNLH